MALIFEHHDGDWETTKPGWHECSVRAEHIDRYFEILDWVEQHVGKHTRHCRWCVTDTSTASFKFRYERDYIMFTLRWS